MSQYDGAFEDIKSCIRLAPNDKIYREFFEKVKANRKADSGSQAAAMQKMFSQGMYNEKEAVKVAKDLSKLPDFKPENP